MKYADLVFAGAPIGPPTMPTAFPCKGFRVVPILAAGATAVEVLAAYAALTVTVQRSSVARQNSNVVPVGITDTYAVTGPDWVRSPGFSTLLITGGQAGVTYRVTWAEDCYEVLDVAAPPYLNGFQGPGAAPSPSTTSTTGSSTTQAQASLANIPAGAVGIDVSGKAGVALNLVAPATQTFTGGDVVWWRYDAFSATWCQTGIVESVPTGFRGAALGDKELLVTPANTRLFAELRNVTCSGAGNVTVNLYAR